MDVPKGTIPFGIVTLFLALFAGFYVFFDASVVSFFHSVGKITGGQLSPHPVVSDAFAAFTLFLTAVCTITVSQISLNITFHLAPPTPLNTDSNITIFAAISPQHTCQTVLFHLSFIYSFSWIILLLRACEFFRHCRMKQALFKKRIQHLQTKMLSIF